MFPQAFILMSRLKIPDNFSLIGRLGKTYQLEGGLRLYTELEDEILVGLKQLFIEGVGSSDIRSLKRVGKDLIVYLTRALTLEQAKTLVNKHVYVPNDLLPENTLEDFIGLPVFLDGQAFGHVVDLEEGLQSLLIIEANHQEILIPLEASYVRADDNGIFLEDVPEGLLD